MQRTLGHGLQRNYNLAMVLRTSILVLLAALAAGCSRPVDDGFAGLRQMAEVQVKVAAPGAKKRIIHVADWHFVPPDLFALDLEAVEGRKLAPQEIERRYAKFLKDVEDVQIEQEGILRQ